MKMKIIIINPPAYHNKDYIREGRCMQTKSSWAALWMPLSLTYLAAVLRRDGHDILLIDCIAEGVNQQGLAKLMSDFSPQLAIINTAFPSIKGDMEATKLVKNLNPEINPVRNQKFLNGIKTVIIGMYPTLLEKKCLEEFPQIDYVVVGEPEWVISGLVKTLSANNFFENVNPVRNQKFLNGVNGLIYRCGNEIVMNPPQNLFRNDLAGLPFPARDLLNNDKYRLPTNGEKFTLLSVGRGCPYNCTFCVANVYYGKRFRKRPIESIMAEIEECVEKYDIKNFLFWGENFTLEPDYGEKICDEIVKRNIKINWSTTSRVDTLNERLLEKMREAGCILLGLGIESANQEILNLAKKGTTLPQIKRAISMVKKANISSIGHFIFGLPGETKETAKATVNFACRSDIDYAQFYCAVPYPKTELGKIAEEKNWIETNTLSRFDLTKSVLRNENLSSGEIKKLRDRAYFRFYFRPKIILKTAREVKSFKSLLSVLNFLNWIKPRED